MKGLEVFFHVRFIVLIVVVLVCIHGKDHGDINFSRKGALIIIVGQGREGRADHKGTDHARWFPKENGRTDDDGICLIDFLQRFRQAIFPVALPGDGHLFILTGQTAAAVGKVQLI